MYRKNVAGQFIYFLLLDSAGAAVTGATVTAVRGVDGTAQAACTGTVTNMGGGQYRMNLSQADTNGDNIGYLFTAPGAIPVHFNCIMTAANPTDAAGFGLSRLDAAVTTRSTYAGADTAGTTTLLARLTAPRATALDNLDATISSRSTYAGADTSGTTTLLSRLTGPRATLLDNLDAAVSSRSTYNGADTAGVTTLLGRLTGPRATALDLLDVAVSTRMASGAVALDAAGREAIADAILARNIAGGANGGRTVGEAHAFVRSRWNIVGTTLTVYANDDTTALWTGEIVPGPGGVITGMDPA